MAYEIPGYGFTLVAGEDLSAAQFTFVKLDSNGDVVQCTGITDEPVGVLQNDPDDEEEATILATGISKLVADSAIAIGDELGTSADGQADTIVSGTDTTVFKVGKALQAASGAGTIFSALINCLAPNRAA